MFRDRPGFYIHKVNKHRLSVLVPYTDKFTEAVKPLKGQFYEGTWNFAYTDKRKVLAIIDGIYCTDYLPTFDAWEEKRVEGIRRRNEDTEVRFAALMRELRSKKVGTD